MKKLLSVLACVFLLSGTAYGGLVAHWSFNDKDNIGFDESGNGNTAVPNGSILWKDGALHFSGDDYLDVSIGPSALQEYTVCVRFKSGSSLIKDVTYLITRGTDTQPDNFFLRWAGAGKMSGGHETAGVDVKVDTDSDPASKLNNGKWHELWLTYDGATLRIYRDGTLDASAAAADPPADPGAPVRVGAGNPAGDPATGPDSWFKGFVDDVKIYDEALTPPTIEIVKSSTHTYVDYGFGGNMNHFYPFNLMRFNIDYEVHDGDPKGDYRVIAVAFNKYPPQRPCEYYNKKKQRTVNRRRNKGRDIVKPGAHTLRFAKDVPACAEPPAVEWADCVDVNWKLWLTTKLTKEDRTVVLDKDNWFMDEALFVHSSDHIYKGY